MEELERLRILSGATDLEPAEETASGGGQSPCGSAGIFTHKAILPNGKTITLLKTMLSSCCERNCNYCCFRAGHDIRRETFTPDDFAALFMRLRRAGVVEGLFLSSGIISGGVVTQDKLLATAEILRTKMGFRGYLHLKMMPGLERAQVERAMQLADRVSINLEAPNPSRLAVIAPKKNYYNELVQALTWVDEIRKNEPAYKGWNQHWPSSTTQFVVGGADEPDVEILSTTETLHQRVGLKRAYFSAFKPIEGTPLENHPRVPLMRQNRLYQASFLLRDYGFSMEELPFTDHGNLPLETDPKLMWAQENLCDRPVEVNLADQRELLRVPGFGPKAVDAILNARRTGKLRELSSLEKLHICAQKAAPYILLDGKRPAVQHMLW